MEYNNYNIQKFKLYVNTVPNSAATEGYEFVMPDGTTSEMIPDDCIGGIVQPSHTIPEEPLGNNPRSQISRPPSTCGIGWLPILLTRTYDHYEYVNTKRDDFIETIVRQEINPYFIEIDFFTTINRILPSKSQDLNDYMRDTIKEIQVKNTYFLWNFEYKTTPWIGTRFEGLIGFSIKAPRPADIESTIVRVKGTPYGDAEYLIKEKWYDSSGNLGVVFVDSFPLNNAVETLPGSGHFVEVPDLNGYPGATIEFLRFKSDTTSVDTWFDRVGKNMILPTKKESDINNIVDLTDIELSVLNWNSVVSKAKYYPIEIWK